MAIALDTLAYARRLREAGFSDAQADGQAEALAAAMTDTLATKQDLNEMNARIDTRFAQVDTRFSQVDARFARLEARFDYFEKHFDSRLDEMERRWVLRLDGRLADLERRVTVRMLAGIAAVSALVKVL